MDWAFLAFSETWTVFNAARLRMRFTPLDFSILESSMEFAIERD
jgi:hypothetical protein